MNFSDALEELETGAKISRKQWKKDYAHCDKCYLTRAGIMIDGVFEESPLLFWIMLVDNNFKDEDDDSVGLKAWGILSEDWEIVDESN